MHKTFEDRPIVGRIAGEGPDVPAHNRDRVQ